MKIVAVSQLALYIALAILVAGVSTLALMHVGKSEAQVIEEVLRQDKAVIEKGLNQNGDLRQFVDSINRVSKQVGERDLSRCPSDFRAAHGRFADAWGEMAAWARKLPTSRAEAVWMGALNGLTGEADGGGERLENEGHQRMQAIRMAWEAMSKVAGGHGAIVPLIK